MTAPVPRWRWLPDPTTRPSAPGNEPFTRRDGLIVIILVVASIAIDLILRALGT